MNSPNLPTRRIPIPTSEIFSTHAMARSLHGLGIRQPDKFYSSRIMQTLPQSSERGELRMKRLRMLGLALAAVFCAGQANAEELTGTLKKIKETGTINVAYHDPSIALRSREHHPQH